MMEIFDSLNLSGNVIVLDKTVFSLGHRDTSDERKARFFATLRPITRAPRKEQDRKKVKYVWILTTLVHLSVGRAARKGCHLCHLHGSLRSIVNIPVRRKKAASSVAFLTDGHIVDTVRSISNGASDNGRTAEVYWTKARKNRTVTETKWCLLFLAVLKVWFSFQIKDRTFQRHLRNPCLRWFLVDVPSTALLSQAWLKRDTILPRDSSPSSPPSVGVGI